MSNLLRYSYNIRDSRTIFAIAFDPVEVRIFCLLRMDLLDFMIFRFAYLQMDILFSRIQIVLKEFVIISIDKFQLYIFIYIIFVLVLYRITSFNF